VCHVISVNSRFSNSRENSTTLFVFWRIELKRFRIKSAIKRYTPSMLLTVAKSLRGDFCFQHKFASCPFCEKRSFLWAGKPPSLTLECKFCGSSSRERIFYYALKNGLIRVPEPILHFAPEIALEKLLRNNHLNYRTADKYLIADCCLDLDSIDLADKSVGTLIVSHVIDLTYFTQSVCEIKRVLSDGGCAILFVEISDDLQDSIEIADVQEWTKLMVREYQGQKFILGRDFYAYLERHFRSVTRFRPSLEAATSIGASPVETLFFLEK
jgi:hypothetical protein